MAFAPVCGQTTKQLMTVVHTDGSTSVFKVDQVAEVNFSQVQLVALHNQWAYGQEVTDISRVTMTDADGAYAFSLSGQDAASALHVIVPKEMAGQKVDLASEEAHGVKVVAGGDTLVLTGTLQVRFDKSGKNVALTLEAETADLTDVRCKWNGAFVQTFAASDEMRVTNVNVADTFAIASALVVNPSTIGAPTHFAFGDVEATSAEQLKAGHAAVALGISASKLYAGSIDMAAEPESFTFRYVDYDSRIVYDKVKAGTIVTAQNAEGHVYVKVEATMDDNRLVELEYFGPVAEVESLDAMIPEAVAENGYKYYNSDGDVAMNKTLGTSYVEEYKGNYTFYFVPEGDSKFSSDRVTLKVSADLVNAGEVNIAELDDEAIFDLKFKSIGLQSVAAGHGYGNTPNNGVLSISRDDDGTYSISLEISNRYKSPWGDSVAGDNTKLVLRYHGVMENY